MFKIGDKVVYKSVSLCNVESVETPVFVKEKDKKYYKLRQLFSIGNDVIYVPVDNEKSLRSVISKEEAQNYFDMLPDMEYELCVPRQPAMISAHFNAVLADGSLHSSLTALKEILCRQHEYDKDGKRLRQVEDALLKNLMKTVCEEFSVVLDEDIEVIKEKIKNAATGQ